MRRLSLKKFYWLLILILPFIDTLNGILNNGGNEGGLSAGILYRIVVFVVAMFFCLNGKMNANIFISMIFVFVALFFSIVIGSVHTFEYLNKIFRLLLPMVIIISFEVHSPKQCWEAKYCNSIFSLWSIFFPLTILIPYALGLGFNTYGLGAAGYKGFYYAQNDIGYILIILYLYTIFELSQGFTMGRLVTAMFLLVSNLMLGLKSNYLLVASISVGYLFIAAKKRGTQLSKLFVIMTIIIGVIVITQVYANDIDLIIARWVYFYNSRDFMSFWTSARWDRVAPALEWMKAKYGIIGIIFGTGMEYTYHTVSVSSNVIEMDIFDIFFQMGIYGLAAVYGFYLRVLKHYRFQGFYKAAFFLSFLVGALAGHVMESALSGMFFSFICCSGIANYKEKNLSYEK